jgi:predicted ribosome quality control (RQC) complex YloA/Tae2 family protein
MCYTDIVNVKGGAWPAGRGCKSLLAEAGRHQVSVEMFGTRWRKTGNKRVTVHKNRVDVQNTEDYTRTKRRAREKIQCVR